jgi:hypothetical protein
MRTLYERLTEAADEVARTLGDPLNDAAKWKHYLSLSSSEQLKWRLREGHREFCRLQRLSYHRFV